jgi:hypothetical protein
LSVAFLLSTWAGLLDAEAGSLVLGKFLKVNFFSTLPLMGGLSL